MGDISLHPFVRIEQGNKSVVVKDWNVLQNDLEAHADEQDDGNLR